MKTSKNLNPRRQSYGSKTPPSIDNIQPQHLHKVNTRRPIRLYSLDSP
jgi:hypothetical protein